MISQEIVKEYFSYNEETGKLHWRKKTSPKATSIVVGSVAGCIHKHGYRVIWLFGKAYKATKLVYLYHKGIYPKEVYCLDNKIDNSKIENLDIQYELPVNFTLNQEAVKFLFNYDLDTGIFTRKVSFNSQALKGSVAGGYNINGYIVIPINNLRVYAHRLAFIYVLGRLPYKDVDHIDRNTSNNAWANLRDCTASDNLCNTSLRIDNKSGYKGVFFIKRINKYYAYVAKNGKREHLGFFKTAEEANIAVMKKREELHKQFTNHGIIDNI
jgi:hypothetical protein